MSLLDIKNSQEQFESTFGALTVINVQAVRDRGASRMRAASNASAVSSVAGGGTLGPGLGRLGSYDITSDEEKEHRPKMRKSSVSGSKGGGKTQLAVKLKKSLRSLQFQNPRGYLEYHQKNQGFQAEYVHEEVHRQGTELQRQGTETYDASMIVDRLETDQYIGPDEDEYFEGDDEVFPDKKSRKGKHKNASSLQLGSWGKTKKEKRKRHPVVECEGMFYVEIMCCVFCVYMEYIYAFHDYMKVADRIWI